MNDLGNLVFQPNIDSELLHLAFAAFAAIFGGITALCGGLGLFMVKRAIRQHDEWKERIEREIAELKSEMGLKTITDGRPADGHSPRVL